MVYCIKRYFYNEGQNNYSPRTLRLIEHNKISFNNQGETCKDEIIRLLLDSLADVPESCYCKTTKIFATLIRTTNTTCLMKYYIGIAFGNHDSSVCTRRREN